MNLKKRLVLLFAVSLASSSVALAKTLNVITTTPDLASLARAVGGDKIKVESLAGATQNPHFVDAKPSLIVKLIKTDLLIKTGLELEAGWEPVLTRGSRNKKIQPGAPGHLDASSAVNPLDVPQNPSRAMGDVHPGGNPHYLLDPENAKKVARLITDKLSELDPDHTSDFEKSYGVFAQKIDEKMAFWQNQMKPFQDASFISYHKVWPYFAERFRLVSMGEIEPKPGIPPTPAHTADLIDRMKKNHVRLILTSPWYERRTPEFIAKETGAAVISMAFFPENVPGGKNYVDILDHNIRMITQALNKNLEAAQ